MDTDKSDERQDERDRRRDKDRHRMIVHKVKSPRTGERMVKLVAGRAVRRALKSKAAV